MKRSAAVIGAVSGMLLAAVLVTACSGGASSGSDSAGGSARSGLLDRGDQPATAGPAAPGGAASSDPNTGSDSTDSSGKSPGSSASDPSAPVLATSVIRTASLQVEIARAADVAARADAAGRIAVADGGSVFADDRTAGAHATAQLTLKVPPDTLATVLTRLAALGKELGRHSSSEDVTAQVADVTSRVRSAQDSLTRLRTLYTHASKVGDIIAIESEISQREADLESLQAQQRTLAAHTSMATVQLDLTARGAALPVTHHDRHGFLGGLAGGWDAFTSTAVAIATGLGAALPFLVLVLVAGAAAWRLRSRRSHPAPEPAAE